MTRPVITIDPAMRFGRPHIRGFSVDVLAEMVWAGDDVDTVASNYGISRGEVLVACWYLSAFGTVRERTAWAAWGRMAHNVMARRNPDFDAIPDPPEMTK